MPHQELARRAVRLIGKNPRRFIIVSNAIMFGQHDPVISRKGAPGAMRF
jgi:hypothetical protein